MAKSTRSKVKRAWRSKKREDSVYAAVEAARLHRLNEKLAAVAAPNAPEPKEQQDGSAPGWCWLTSFGLMDHDDINLDTMEIYMKEASLASPRATKLVPSTML
ncbi:hypothetical protein AX16_000140 [Volvariella volvacea WC 439]|nr:hypothetical protein AX16_000140 [Volvariella volvacea WC 439]